MPIIQMPRGVSPVQVEFIGKDAKEIKRSCKGSLHLSSGCTKVITKEELLYIQTNEKELFKRLHVVPLVDDEPAQKDLTSSRANGSFTSPPVNVSSEEEDDEEED